MKITGTFTFVFFLFLVTIPTTNMLAWDKEAMYTVQVDSREYANGTESKKGGKTKYIFQTDRTPGQFDRVKVQLKVGGEVIDVVNGKELREKMSVACNLDYDEKTLEIPSNPHDLSRSIRSYNQAEADIKVGDSQFKPLLRPQRTLIAAEITPRTALLYSPRGPLTREELDLIEAQGDSLLIDQFLPDKPIAVGETWKLSENLMALLLGLDEVGQSDVKSDLAEVTDKVARFYMSGNVTGAIDGVASEIELKARYRFDLNRKRIDWLGMVIKEKRQSSPVADGFDLTAQVQVTIVPSDHTAGLSKVDLKDLPMRASPELLQLSHLSKQGGWEIVYDRSWHVYRDQQDSAVLRRTEGGELIAQCNCSSLPQTKPDKLISLEEFQEDIKRALTKEFKEFVQAGQTIDEKNCRVLRVVVRGTASDMPFVWNYYHIADQQGRQMSFAFIIEEKYLERFGKADRELIDSLRFIEVKQ